MKGRSPPDDGPPFEARHLPGVENPSGSVRSLAAMQAGASQKLLYLATPRITIPDKNVWESWIFSGPRMKAWKSRRTSRIPTSSPPKSPKTSASSWSNSKPSPRTSAETHRNHDSFRSCISCSTDAGFRPSESWTTRALSTGAPPRICSRSRKIAGKIRLNLVMPPVSREIISTSGEEILRISSS